ncbi:PREDICTED: uncharacterized protein LOC106743911 [Dinoponera quadriceps]|uniref:Uncharacterized protein LOC106743911 n=1 Tax=Dinoponera quadriceps TaxID=609295 RepID=A0A6P3X5X4_DINQU|nr:PREDICTED: uncharacterized protein LOC106743911 [Dinoponera quadriceps]
MKVTELLIVTCCSIIAARSDTDEELLKRASEQLERLAPYRRRADQEALDLANLLDAWRPPMNEDDSKERKLDQAAPWEILEILPEQTDDAAKRTDDKKQIMIADLIADPKYATMMQERIKRGFDAGSASLITSIAGGVLSGVASASSGSAAKASAGSSQHDYGQPAYGPPPAYSYDEKPFGAWDFKKTIFSTVFQALKAISGGVLALKGQLVKGGGYLLAAKGKVISKTGDVITSFGKHLTSSVSTYPASYPPDTYTYEQHPPAQDLGHDPNYQGPPPGPDGYSEANDYPPHSAYSVPSDDNNQGGLLIVAPTKSDPESDQHANVAEAKPDLTKLEESFGGPTIKDFLINVPNGSGGQAIGDQDDNNVNAPIAHPAPTYGAAEHYSSHHDKPVHDSYPVVDQENVYHHHPAAAPPSHHFPNRLPIQQSLEYPPLHLSELDYPHGGGLHGALPPELPLHDGTSVYASLTVDTEPHLPLLGLPKLQPHVDFHGQPQFANLHNSLDGPLRIPLLNPLPDYWQSPSSLGTLNSFRKRNVPQRRMFARRHARYSSSTRPHRL